MHDATSSATPAHIAIIMDGNGRWAKERGVSRAKGHQQGGETLRALIECCRSRPFVTHLTLYAFSSENWKRSPDEIADLMDLLRHYVKREAAAMHQNNLRLRFIGEMETLAPDIQADLAQVQALTAGNTGLTVAIAVSYGARQEIVRAAQRLAQQAVAGQVAPESIDVAMLAQHLYSADMPDPDLLIRTGGEQRISNFLLWQCAYAELYFTDTLWPDFTPADLDAAITDFSRRDRRFGGRK